MRVGYYEPRTPLTWTVLCVTLLVVYIIIIGSQAPARVTTIFVSVSVCLSVCVSVCPEHNSVDFDPILMKLGYVFDINVELCFPG